MSLIIYNIDANLIGLFNNTRFTTHNWLSMSGEEEIVLEVSGDDWARMDVPQGGKLNIKSAEFSAATPDAIGKEATLTVRLSYCAMGDDTEKEESAEMITETTTVASVALGEKPVTEDVSFVFVSDMKPQFHVDGPAVVKIRAVASPEEDVAEEEEEEEEEKAES